MGFRARVPKGNEGRTRWAAVFLAISLLIVPKCACMCLRGEERNWLKGEEGCTIMMRKTESDLASNLLLPLFKISDGQEIK